MSALLLLWTVAFAQEMPVEPPPAEPLEVEAPPATEAPASADDADETEAVAPQAVDEPDEAPTEGAPHEEPPAPASDAPEDVVEPVEEAAPAPDADDEAEDTGGALPAGAHEPGADGEATHDHVEPTPVVPQPVPTVEPLLPFPFDFGWSAPPTAPTPPVAPTVEVEARENPWSNYLLPMPERGLKAAVRLLFWLIVTLVAGRFVGRLRTQLLPTGWLPTLAALTEQALRLFAVFATILLVAALLPEALLPILPIAVIGGALALGISVWTVLPDLWAGVMLSVEQKVVPGQWIRVNELMGEVEHIGFRATRLVDRNDGRVILPNRLLMEHAVSADAVRWPPVDIAVPVPAELSTEQVRALLTEAVMLSPFLAPEEEPALVQEQFHPPIWRVRARIVEAHWADEFEGALRERVRELLETTRAPRPTPVVEDDPDAD